MTIYNTRMLQLLEEAVAKDLADSEKDWCEKIGIFQTNLKPIRSGERSFTIEQMIKAVKLHKTSMDWLCGLSEVKPINPGKLSGLQMIEEGLRLLKSKKVPKLLV